MTEKVTTLHINPGIQRDGTQFAATSYVDGKWVRFQYGKPRKIGGYNGMFLNASGVSRGMIMSSQDGLNYIISGNSDGLEQWTTGQNDGIGFGPTVIEVAGELSTVGITSNGSSYTNGTYYNVPLIGTAGSGALATVIVSSNQIVDIAVTAPGNFYVHNETITINSVDVGGTGTGFLGYAQGLVTYSPNENTLWQFDIGYDSAGNGKNNLIAHQDKI